MTDFKQYQSYSELEKLSRHPLDLTAAGVLTAGRIERFQCRAAGFTYLYAGERVSKEVMTALFQLAKESGAVSKMLLMQSGGGINKIEGFDSENRAVLHTAMRSLYRTTEPKELSAEKLAAAEMEKLKRFLDEIEHKGKFKTIIQVGIGGSDLGPRALYVALKAYAKPGFKACFISNVDPDDAASVLASVNLKETLSVIVSKSGTTLETRTNEALVRAAYTAAGLDPKEHIIAVTGQGSPMDDPERYLRSFYIWDFVGGRYSATSMVGAVALGFTLGLPHFEKILQGAAAMDDLAMEEDCSRNLPLLLALIGIWNRNFLHLATVAVLPYSEALSRFTAHLQQCSMESNGKSCDTQGLFVDFETGPVIWGEPGTNGQHSFFQLIHQGTDIVPVEFIGFTKSQYGSDLAVDKTTSQQKLLANLFAQSLSLSRGQKSDNPNKSFAGNRPSSILLAERLDPYTMGSLLALYEHRIAFEGFIWGINSFDQEGVQLGKHLADRILKIMSKDGQESFPLGEAYLKQLPAADGNALGMRP